MWDKLVNSYKGETKVKNEKLQTCKIQIIWKFENEWDCFFLIMDDIINAMKGLGDKIEDATIVQNVFRLLTPRFDAKVLAIEEM